MKNTLFQIFVVFLCSISTLNAQKLQSPSEFLGYELGSHFTRHHKVVDYFTYIGNNSSNVKFEKYGETNEHRSLNLSFISSEENLKTLENIRVDNLKRTGILSGDSNKEIAIVWLSYNVHGNEACRTEASMLTLYKLITEKQDWLKNTVIIIDPCINPDGRDRYVNWYNQYKNTPYNSNPDVTEHSEPWPGGRANHYLFDLNRDWLWATQLETQQRLKVYNKWMPHVHVDFHEQGVNSPYYFAPAAAPYHEVVTDWQRNFQVQIGKNHAKYFDKNGWLYFTKESFDLLYPSYGDTYPTYMGAIGMTYEQGGSGRAGLSILNNRTVELTLKDRMLYHTTTGLSTVEMASKNASRLVMEFKNYFDNTDLKYKSYILRGDTEKIEGVIELLEKHDIAIRPAQDKTVKVFDYVSKTMKNIKTTSKDYVVSTQQPKGKMVNVLFEPETKLADSATYDITAWSIPYVYGLQGFASQTDFPSDGNTIMASKLTESQKLVKNAYAYVSKWNEVSDAELLGDLLEEGFNVRFSNHPFSLEGKSFEAGSLIVLRGENFHKQNFDAIIAEITSRLKKTMSPVNTGFVDSGYDFGSRNTSVIKNKKIAVLSGEGTSSLSFGEIWHFFETQLKYPIHVLNTKNFKRVDLKKYDVLVLPNRYNASKDALKILSDFVSKGGTIIAIGSAVNSFADKEGFQLKKKTEDEDEDKEPDLKTYNLRGRERIKGAVLGSIFKSNIDNTHPLAFGYKNHYFSLKNSANAYELLEKGVNVGYFSEDSKNISGFTGMTALEKIPNSLLFGVEQKGRGRIIYMVDNPLYRSFWENGKLFFANAVFLN